MSNEAVLHTHATTEVHQDEHGEESVEALNHVASRSRNEEQQITDGREDKQADAQPNGECARDAVMLLERREQPPDNPNQNGDAEQPRQDARYYS